MPPRWVLPGWLSPNTSSSKIWGFWMSSSSQPEPICKASNWAHSWRWGALLCLISIGSSSRRLPGGRRFVFRAAGCRPLPGALRAWGFWELFPACGGKSPHYAVLRDFPGKAGPLPHGCHSPRRASAPAFPYQPAACPVWTGTLYHRLRKMLRPILWPAGACGSAGGKAALCA